MHKKDYVAIARAFAETRPGIVKTEGSWVRAMRAIADHCEADNPRFNRERFVSACMDWGGLAS